MAEARDVVIYTYNCKPENENPALQKCIQIWDCKECGLFLPYINAPHLCIYDYDIDEGFSEKDSYYEKFGEKMQNYIRDPSQRIWVIFLKDCGTCFKILTENDVRAV